jgi:hypothetical protein
MTSLLGLKLPEENAAQLRGFGAGALEGAAGFLNPIDLTTTVLPMLKPAGMVSPLARGAVRVGSGLLAGRGATRTYEGYEEGKPGQMAQGAFEAALGLAGVAAPGPKRAPAAAAAPEAAAVEAALPDVPKLVSPADLRAQRLQTEAARTRGATARASMAEKKLERMLAPPAAPPKPTPLSTAPPAGKASTPAEIATDKAFPLSARTSDPSRIPLGGEVPLSMPIAEGAGAGKRLQILPVERAPSGKIKTIRVGEYEIDLSKLPPGKLTGDEVRDMVLGRGRLLARAKGKQLPAQAIGELDRMGLEYRRTTTDLQKLEAAAAASTDPMAAVQLQQLQQGKYELGYKLAKQTRDTLAEAMKDESGQINPAMLLMLGRASAVTGAGIAGYALTDDPEDKLTNAALAAFTAGFATYAIPAVYQSIAAAAGKGGVGHKTVDEYMYASMLSRPATIIRSTTGQLSGAAHGVLTRLLEGRTDDALAIITDIMQHAPRRYLDALQHGTTTSRLAGATGRRTTGGIVGVPLRLIGASDDAVIPALKAGGFSLEDAQRLTLQGVPQTDFGKNVVRLFTTNWIGRLMQPFSKVGVHMAEQPLMPFFRKDLPMAQRIAQGAITAGTGAAAYGLGGDHDPRYDPYLIALGGPNAIPVALGLAASWAQEQDKDVGAALMRTLDQQNPLDSTVSGTIRGIPSRVIPGVVGDVARVLDPVVRQRGGEAQGALRNRIPGHAGGYGREALPERDTPRDIFGKDLPFQQPAETAIGRLLLGDPSEQNLPTRYPHDNPTARTLKDLGVAMQSPRGTLSVRGKDVPLPKPVQERAIQMKGKALETALEQLMQTPGWSQLDPQQQKDAVEQVRLIVGRVTGGEQMRKLLMLATMENLKAATP